MLPMHLSTRLLVACKSLESKKKEHCFNACKYMIGKFPKFKLTPNTNLLVSHRQTMIQVNFIYLYSSHVYVPTY